jgi:UPF0755 protein
MKTLRRLGLFVLFVAAAGGYALWRAERPYQGFTGDVFVELPHGTSAGAIADKLAEAGVVRSRWDFLIARALRRARVLQAGEYRFQQPANACDIVSRIQRGDIFYFELTIPEGKNLFDIAAIAEHIGLLKGSDFIQAAQDPALIRDLDPRAPTLEGYLFPDTYRLPRHTTADRLCRLMTGKFRDAWHSLRTTADPHHTVTLASLVEKEGKLPEERPRIAAVFTNRLEVGMKLDCDPTTIYAAILRGRYNGVIHRSDLDSDHPYNTYRHPGLPPGPIANPGMASIRAALEPADFDALYFVARADGSGGHEFSSDIAAHHSAVSRYHRAIGR